MTPASNPAADPVVISGMGVISPLGSSPRELFENLLAGASGAGPIRGFPLADYPEMKSRIACEVRDFDPQALLGKKRVRRTARFAQMASAAALQARDDAGLDLAQIEPGRTGCVIGSTADYTTIEKQHASLLNRGPGRQNPLAVPKSIPNMAAANAAIDLGIHGVNLGAHTACATGSHTLALARLLLLAGEAEVIFAGGAEAAITPLTVDAYGCMGVLSSRNEDPAGASRPFDAGRDGFVIGEGAAVMVLERESRARRRGAEIYARLSGAGMTTDASSVAMPEKEGRWAAAAMEQALRSAGLNPEDIGYINAHGTSTRANDAIESRAIQTVFGPPEACPPVSSTKSMTGHTLAAAGALEAAITALSLQRGVIPPTINQETPDPDCPLDTVPNQAREIPLRAALSNAFGFGGQNGVLCLTRAG